MNAERPDPTEVVAPDARDTLGVIREDRRGAAELVAELPLRLVASDFGATMGVEVFLGTTPVIAVMPGTRHADKAVCIVSEALAKGLAELIRNADPTLRPFDPDARFDDEERYYADPANGLPDRS